MKNMEMDITGSTSLEGDVGATPRSPESVLGPLGSVSVVSVSFSGGLCVCIEEVANTLLISHRLVPRLPKFRLQ